MGAPHLVDGVDEIHAALALKRHDLEIIDYGLKHAIGQREVGYGDAWVIADNLIKDGLLGKLINFSFERSIGNTLELL